MRGRLGHSNLQWPIRVDPRLGESHCRRLSRSCLGDEAGPPAGPSGWCLGSESAPEASAHPVISGSPKNPGARRGCPDQRVKVDKFAGPDSESRGPAASTLAVESS